ncbi:MAG TPA: glucose-6-phosphate dehydrogenase assembly protein OpcA, partial [Thermoleophilaceae bacterium]|nr:glucose-6-phosphate dehydrogenase assembly protein OpcA [Thermoleophilaceae bacterium]
MSENVWAEQGATLSAIESALRKLLMERHAAVDAFVPARVLNLVVVVDRDWRGEVANRLEGVGRYHPSRTIVCAVEPGRSSIDARVTVGSEEDLGPGELSLGREHVALELGEEHLGHLDTIVDPLVVTDLATVVWAPHGHREGVDALMRLAQVVLVDSLDEPSIGSALERVRELSERCYVVDLAWLRGTPWRERVAATFDPPAWRGELGAIDSVEVRHRPDSVAAALLLVGWLGSRLGWRPEGLIEHEGSLRGHARSGRREVQVMLRSDPRQTVPGLSGVTVSTGSGMSISLDRGPGGLAAERRTAKGRTSRWTVVGASRGEA